MAEALRSYEGKEVIALAEGVEKIRAASEARRDPDFVIKSRTDTLATHGIELVLENRTRG